MYIVLIKFSSKCKLLLCYTEVGTMGCEGKTANYLLKQSRSKYLIRWIRLGDNEGQAVL